MKNKLMQFLLRVFILAAFLSACSDDPESINEEEIITTVTVTLTPEAGEVVTLAWDDVNLDAQVEDEELHVSGPLKMNTQYAAVIELLNKSTDPGIDITEEVKEEREDHIICFTATGLNITFNPTDEDRNGLPVGITSTWTPTAAGTGTITIALRHQPGVKTGDCPGAGETDARVEFNVEIAEPL